MPLALPDHWLWDFWFAVDGDDVHVFYLQAPRSLGDPELRHHHATIGHAVSRDLHSWRVLPTALDRGAPGAFDDLATWTGSVLRAEGRWHMYYTGISRAEHGLVERIGWASSTDLLTWTRNGCVVTADERWYETRTTGGAEEAWRDPWVWWHEDTARWHMLITARAGQGPADGRGVIGHASSVDLAHWRVEPPLSAPGEFYHLEVPQLVRLGNTWRILFCATGSDHSAVRRSRPGFRPQGGTHQLVADQPLGPYALDGDDWLLADERASHYAGRLLHHRGRWLFFAWQHLDHDGRFLGRLSDPMPLHLTDDGRPVIVEPGRR